MRILPIVSILADTTKKPRVYIARGLKILMPESTSTKIERPPIVVIMGHIDHGKSTLLDYIRKSTIVDDEVGGITQHMGAYEIDHDSVEHGTKKITFLDTPGHEAFMAIRERGAKVADIAILLVSAEDGVMPQTKEALQIIIKDKLPYIVAINKVDSSKADVEKTKNSLMENEVYLEGSGGQIPFVLISAKTGIGVPDLLDTILLLAQVEGLTADTAVRAEGIAVEAHRDSRKGVTATLIIKNGTLKIGMYLACEKAFSPVRRIEDSYGKERSSCSFSEPVVISGWNDLPSVGCTFKSFASKKEADEYCGGCTKKSEQAPQAEPESEANAMDVIIPIIIKTDVAGTSEAIEFELNKIKVENVRLKIVRLKTGNIGEADMQLAAGKEGTVVVGFGVNIDPQAEALRERDSIQTATFDIIYELTAWIKGIAESRKPHLEIENVIGTAKIIRKFSTTKHLHVAGGKVKEGSLKVGAKVKILRRGEQIDIGTIKELQAQKLKTKEVSEGSEFGIAIESKMEIAEGDEIQAFEKVTT